VSACREHGHREPGRARTRLFRNRRARNGPGHLPKEPGPLRAQAGLSPEQWSLPLRPVGLTVGCLVGKADRRHIRRNVRVTVTRYGCDCCAEPRAGFGVDQRVDYCRRGVVRNVARCRGQAVETRAAVRSLWRFRHSDGSTIGCRGGVAACPPPPACACSIPVGDAASGGTVSTAL